jgi:hypothetical protein
MNEEVFEDGSPASGVRNRLFVSLLGLWTALLDEWFGGFMFDVVVVSILVLVTFFIFILLPVTTS